MEIPSRPRPTFHFAPAANWMNDPNGLVFWDGRYHLFYQHNPAGTVPEKMCWGHADSSDLVHWRDLPVALEPTPGSVDQDGCWSGRAVVHDGEVYLLYTGLRDGRQRPCLAKAVDGRLVSFQKLGTNPIISAEPLPGLFGFRDHAVRQVDGEVRQLIGSGSPALGGCLLEYRSKDLVNWDYSGVFISAKSAGFPGGMWECPDLFRLGERWFIVVSVLDQRDQRGVMSIAGSIEGGTFLPELTARLDLGSRWYAPQSFDGPDGRRISFGWLRERQAELPERERGRVGVMSLPRELFVAPDGALGMAPAAEMASLRAGVIRRVGDDGGTVRLEPGRGLDAFEVEATCAGDGPLLFDLLDEHGDLVVQVAVGQSRIEMSRSVLLPLPLGPVTAGVVRVFYDGGICEVFTATGAVRSEIFYQCPPVHRIAMRAQPPRTAKVIETVRAWELASIW